MKLSFDFSELTRLAEHMMPDGIDFSLQTSCDENKFGLTDLELGIGKSVMLCDLDRTETLLSYQGRQVLLYTLDSSSRLNNSSTILSPVKKFHITRCNTLDNFQQKDPLALYHVTNSFNDSFIRTDGNTETIVSLCVCPLCLKRLNYRGSLNVGLCKKNTNEFSKKTFFSEYSTQFNRTPKTFDDPIRLGYHSGDNADLIKGGFDFTCSVCNVDLSTKPELGYNHPSHGLICNDCHRKKADYQGDYIHRDSIRQIQKLRLNQGILSVSSWDDVFKFTDVAFHGDLLAAQEQGYELPVLEYEVECENGEKTCLDVAWVKRSIGLYSQAIKCPSWRLLMAGEMVMHLYRYDV